MNLTKRTTILLLASALAAGAICIVFMTKRTQKDSNTQANVAKPALTVTAQKPLLSDWQESITTTGNVVPWQEAKIGSEINNLRVQEVYVDVGDRVQKGQILLRLNDRVPAADSRQVAAQLQEAQANLQITKDNVARSKSLKEQGFISEQQLAKELSQQEGAQAKIRAVQASLDAQNARTGQTAIYAPDSGVISARTVSVGDMASSAEMLRLIRQNKYQWIGAVNAEQMQQITIGMPVEFFNSRGKILDAKVSIISPTLDPKTRQGQIFVLMNEPTHKEKVRPGMLVSAKIRMGTQKSLTVPRESIIIKDTDPFVFVLDPQTLRVKKTSVVIGDTQGQSTAVYKGLSDTDLVVVKGAAFLNDQDLVKLVNDETITAPPEKKPSTNPVRP